MIKTARFVFLGVWISFVSLADEASSGHGTPGGENTATDIRLREPFPGKAAAESGAFNAREFKLSDLVRDVAAGNHFSIPAGGHAFLRQMLGSGPDIQFTAKPMTGRYAYVKHDMSPSIWLNSNSQPKRLGEAICHELLHFQDCREFKPIAGFDRDGLSRDDLKVFTPVLAQLVNEISHEFVKKRLEEFGYVAPMRDNADDQMKTMTSALAATEEAFAGISGQLAKTPERKTSLKIGNLQALYQNLMVMNLRDELLFGGIYQNDLNALMDRFQALLDFVRRSAPEDARFKRAYLRIREPADAIRRGCEAYQDSDGSTASRYALLVDTLNHIYDHVGIVFEMPEKPSEALLLKVTATSGKPGDSFVLDGELTFSNVRLFVPGNQLTETAGVKKSHGLALYGQGDLKYKEGQPYDFANVNAPKGGTLNLSRMGSSTKLNPFSLKGTSAPGIGLCFESLGSTSVDPDEPYSVYGELAQYMELADDKLSITFYLHPKARFSDRRPVTADDVVFSFAIIKDPGYNPNTRTLYKDVTGVRKIDDRTVRFFFAKYTRKLPLLIAQLSILPRHVYGVEGKLFGKDFDSVVPVGSGPYLLDSYDHSSFVTMKRDPDWWGKDLPLNRGRFNFDTITYHIYQSSKSILLALKGGTIDIEQINSSSDWHNEFNGDNVKLGYMRKRAFHANRVKGMQGFFMNLRNPVFQDIRVRKAIASVMDFEFMNKNLFYGQYTRSVCAWDNKPEMMSRGPAKGAVRDELVRLFKKYNDPAKGIIHVPKEAILVGPRIMGQTMDGEMQSIDDRVRAANAYLDSIGWLYDPDAQVRKKGDLSLRFEFMIMGKGFQRICDPYIDRLREIGIDASFVITQPAEFIKRRKTFDFDVIVGHLGGIECPGAELNMIYHSSTAGTRGSYNYLGLQNPAIDEVIEKIVKSETRGEVVEYVQVLDRILCANHYVVPQWYIPSDRSIYWNKFSMPETYTGKMGLVGNAVNFWWYDADRAEQLKAARAAGQPMNNARRD